MNDICPRVSLLPTSLSTMMKRAQVSLGLMNWEQSSENQAYSDAKLWSDELRGEERRILYAGWRGQINQCR